MITFGKVGKNGADYFKPEDYYLSDKGTWGGRLSDDLKLEGEVKKDDLSNVLNGFDKEGNKLTKSAGTKEHRSGRDITFSPPKEVTIAGLVDKRISEAHLYAVNVIMKYIEDNMAQTRTYVDKKNEYEKTDNLAYAKFTHLTNRNAEPQLHTHVVVMNMTKDENGKTKALSNEIIFKNKHNLDVMYKNVLAGKLQEIGYGINVTDKEHAIYGLKNSDKHIKDALSTRTAQILEKKEELRQNPKYKDYSEKQLAEIATLSTRKSKSEYDYMTKEDLYESVDSLVRDQLNISLEDYVHNMQNQEREIEYKSLDANFRRAVSSIHENKSAFTREQLFAEVAKLNIGEYTHEEILQFIHNKEKDGQLINMGELSTSVGHEQYYTTPGMRQTEQNVMNLAHSMRGNSGIVVDADAVNKLVTEREQQGFKLNDSQAGALTAIANSADQLFILQGDAGTGKTRGVIANLKILAEAEGYSIKGLAPTGKAAQELQNKASIESQTIDKFLLRPPQDAQDKSILVVDEASMISSRKMEQLLEHAQETGTNVLLIGDVKQFKPVGAGKMFEEMQNAGLTNYSMTEVVRQETEHMREIVNLLKSAHSGQKTQEMLNMAFSRINEQGHFHNIESKEARSTAMVKEFMQSVRSGMDTVIITSTNNDKDQLNEMIRGEKKNDGELQETKEIETLKPKSLSESKAMDSEFYRKDDMLIAEKDIITTSGTIPKGSILEITARPEAGKNLKVKCGDKSYSLDPEMNSSSYSIHSKVTKDFGVGDSIVFTKNHGAEIQNGLTGTVSEINGNIFKVTTRDGAELYINSEFYRHIDHAYAITGYKSQGGDYHKVIWNADHEKNLNYNSAYVPITRATHDVSVYTSFGKDSLEHIKKEDHEAAIEMLSFKVSHEQEKESTIEHDAAIQISEADNLIQERENLLEI